MSMPEVTIVDTSTRDGAVALPHFGTSEKIALANKLIQSGIQKIDCAGFIHPRIRPENADAEEVIKAVNRRSGVKLIGISPNEVACRRALNTDIDEIGTLIASTESFNQSILGTSIRETLYKTLSAIFQASAQQGKSLRVYLNSAFFCQFEGRIPTQTIVELVSKLDFMGAHEISLVDTPGMANPYQVKEMVRALLDQKFKAHIAVHFHNTCGLGLANCLAAYEAGVRTFDTAIGGLSGSPFGTPKMGIGSWNIPTEDLVYLFEQIGVDTGLNLEEIIEIAQFAQELTQTELSGNIPKARKMFRPANYPNPLNMF